MPKRIFVLIGSFLCHLLVNGQPGRSTQVAEKLRQFSMSHPIEKAYLHFDKHYYAAGDTVYFKAYVTMGERLELSRISGVLHVDLINGNKTIDQSIKLQLINGLCHGDFALPDSLPAGDYRVRVYTRWMRNEGDDAFFEQAITVGSATQKNIAESASRQSNTVARPDLQFFPEGGQLLAGVSCKLAFKATAPNGLGIAVQGTVTDETGKEVTHFTAMHLGMGCLNFIPESGKTYAAKVTFADGSEDKISLPPVNNKGIVLKISDNDLAKASVQLIATDAYFTENHGKPFSFVVYAHGLANTVSCSLDSPVMHFTVLKRHLHSGITRLTLFSEQNEPLSGRLLFVENSDHLTLEVNSDPAVYHPRGQVRLRIHAMDRADSSAAGQFSVSVVDESKVGSEDNREQTIFSSLLLSSELKGLIEQPGYYFNHPDNDTRASLDLVMLTHGFRKFEWKQVLSDIYPPLAFQPETGLEISGLAKNLLGRPLAGATVTLLPPQGSFLSQVTDERGGFRFSNLLFTDTARFILQAVNSKGGNKTQLIYVGDNSQPTVNKSKVTSGQGSDPQEELAYLANRKQQLENEAMYGSVKGKLLKEVKIKSFKADNNYRSSNLGGPGHADQVLHADEISNQGGQLSDRLNGRLHRVEFTKGPDHFSTYAAIRGFGPALIIIDGARMGGGYNINNINAEDVETVEVLLGANASIYGIGAGAGAIIITTKQGTGTALKDIHAVGILPITVQGFYKAREFYAPKYDHTDLSPGRKDLRSTIYWQPDLTTGKDGNASLSYFNADGKGTYRVTIEGIDNKGNLGRAVYRYKVD